VYLLWDVLECCSWYISSFIPTALSVPFTNYLPSTTRFIKKGVSVMRLLTVLTCSETLIISLTKCVLNPFQ